MFIMYISDTYIETQAFLRFYDIQKNNILGNTYQFCEGRISNKIQIIKRNTRPIDKTILICRFYRFSMLTLFIEIFDHEVCWVIVRVFQLRVDFEREFLKQVKSKKNSVHLFFE